MQIYNNIGAELPGFERGVGLGFFDGVHCGHQELLRTLSYRCHAMNLRPAVFTFLMHPLQLLEKNSFPGYIISRSERLHKIENCGIDELFLQPFDEKFSHLSPDEFLEEILYKKMQARLVVVGSDYRFGYRGSGDIDLLQKWAEVKGVHVEVVSQVRLYGDKVSSSRIRGLIKRGDVALAGRMLGSAYKIRGEVITGRGLGLKLGFPTANQTLPADLVCPAYGVYATRTKVGEKTYDSVTNVGLRPTVDPDNRVPLIETYLYDMQQRLYGETITVEFLEMIRPELSFASLDELKEKIAADLLEVEKWHRQCELVCRRATVGEIPFYWLPTERFSRAALYLVFSCPVESRLFTGMILLTRILTSSCRKFPTRAQLAAEMNSLYGADIEAHVEKKGDLQLVIFSVESLLRWTDGSSPFAAACDLLFDMLLEPLFDKDGMFLDSVVKTQRQNLLLEHLSRENDRTRYAYDRFINILCGAKPHGIPALGDREILQELGREDLAEAYNFLLTKMQLVCLGAGRQDRQIAEKCMAGLGRMPRTPRPAYLPGAYPSPPDLTNRFEQQEEKKVQQSRVVMAFSGLPPYFSFSSFTAKVLNNMLGGDVHSLLFAEVREKQGLAYSVFSMYQSYLTLLIILAGVSPSKTDQAVTTIRDQIDKLKSGDFPDQLLQRSKEMTRSSLLAIDDDIISMLEYQVSGLFHGRSLSRGDALDLLAMVDRRQIIDLARKLEPVATYILQPGEDSFAISMEENVDV